MAVSATSARMKCLSLRRSTPTAEARRGDQQDDERHGDRRATLPSRQTFLTAARPNRPLGIAASARMTTEKTTIWV